jgi:hypothetical protein
MSETYEVGTRAWQPDQTEGWVPSEVEQKLVQGDQMRLIFRLANGEVRCACLVMFVVVVAVIFAMWQLVLGNHTLTIVIAFSGSGMETAPRSTFPRVC